MALVDGLGCWMRFDPAPGRRRSAGGLFVDRDGVVIEDRGLLSDPEEVRLLEGAAEAIAGLNARGVPVAMVTNQSGVGRGYFDWPAFEAVQAEIERQLAAAGARLDAVLACGYHAEASGPFRRDRHPWRKPEPGMILAAAEYLELKLERSWMAGDQLTDIQAGLAAGLKGGLFIGDDRLRDQALALSSSSFDVIAARSLLGGLAQLPL